MLSLLVYTLLLFVHTHITATIICDVVSRIQPTLNKKKPYFYKRRTVSMFVFSSSRPKQFRNYREVFTAKNLHPIKNRADKRLIPPSQPLKLFSQSSGCERRWSPEAF